MIRLTYAQACDIKEALEEILLSEELTHHVREHIQSMVDMLDDLLDAYTGEHYAR